MSDPFYRTRLVFGNAAMARLAAARVAIFGLGGVGGAAAEALVRAGIGALDLIDPDTVSVTNLNRQILATTETLGKNKAEVAAARARAISPACAVRAIPVFFLPETRDRFDFSQYDYVIDAVDTVTAKMELIKACRDAGVPIISSMGTGNKTDPAAFRTADIYETRVCPLARIMRGLCRKNGIERLKVVYSEEPPLSPQPLAAENPKRRQTPGSVAFVPSVVGLIMAGEIIKDICR